MQLKGCWIFRTKESLGQLCYTYLKKSNHSVDFQNLNKPWLASRIDKTVQDIWITFNMFQNSQRHFKYLVALSHWFML